MREFHVSVGSTQMAMVRDEEGGYFVRFRVSEADFILLDSLGQLR